MKLKEQKKLGMLYFVLGAVLAIAGYFIKSSWLASVGGGVCVLGLVRLLRAARLSRDPEQAADYDASLQDERTAYVANKARTTHKSLPPVSRSPNKTGEAAISRTGAI